MPPSLVMAPARVLEERDQPSVLTKEKVWPPKMGVVTGLRTSLLLALAPHSLVTGYFSKVAGMHPQEAQTRRNLLSAIFIPLDLAVTSFSVITGLPLLLHLMKSS